MDPRSHNRAPRISSRQPHSVWPRLPLRDRFPLRSSRSSWSAVISFHSCCVVVAGETKNVAVSSFSPPPSYRPMIEVNETKLVFRPCPPKKRQNSESQTKSKREILASDLGLELCGFSTHTHTLSLSLSFSISMISFLYKIVDGVGRNEAEIQRFSRNGRSILSQTVCLMRHIVLF